MKLENHPLADQFPRMSDIEYEALREDIREFGLKEEILLFEGEILDGRNRYQACLDSDIEPRTKEFNGSYEEAKKQSASANLTRRHLSKSQKAMVLVKSGLVSAPSSNHRSPSGNGQGIRGAALRYGVNHMTIYKAFFVHDRDKELASDVMDGKISVGKAEADIRAKEDGKAKSNREKSPSDKMLKQVSELLSKNRDRAAKQMALKYLQLAVEALQPK